MTEVLVTMCLFSVLVPSVLMMSLHLSGAAKAGAEHTETISDARYLQQFFVQTVNAGKRLRFLDNGDKLLLSQYNATTGGWDDAMFVFSETDPDHALVYYPSISNASARILSSHVYRNNKRKIFSSDGEGVRIDLYVGLRDPMSEEKIRGTYRTSGTFINLMATPRNKD